MSVSELAVLTVRPAGPSERWVRAAKRARLLSWASLGWMSVEGLVGAARRL